MSLHLILWITVFIVLYLAMGWLTLVLNYMFKIKNNIPFLVVIVWPLVLVVEGLGLGIKWLDDAAKSLAGRDGK